MPKKKSKPAPKGLSPQEVARANQQGFDHAKNAVPLLQFDDMMSNFSGFGGSITDDFSQLFNQIIGRGEGATGLAPPAPQQQVDPYEARIQELMTNRGMSRDQAVANQASAMRQGGDLDNNGATTNQEWAQYQQQQQPQQGYQAQQPQTPPQMAAQQPQPGAYQGVQLTPDQMASIQKFNRYGRGMA